MVASDYYKWKESLVEDNDDDLFEEDEEVEQAEEQAEEQA